MIHCYCQRGVSCLLLWLTDWGPVRHQPSCCPRLSVLAAHAISRHRGRWKHKSLCSGVEALHAWKQRQPGLLRCSLFTFACAYYWSALKAAPAPPASFVSWFQRFFCLSSSWKGMQLEQFCCCICFSIKTALTLFPSRPVAVRNIAADVHVRMKRWNSWCCDSCVFTAWGCVIFIAGCVRMLIIMSPLVLLVSLHSQFLFLFWRSWILVQSYLLLKFKTLRGMIYTLKPTFVSCVFSFIRLTNVWFNVPDILHWIYDFTL